MTPEIPRKNGSPKPFLMIMGGGRVGRDLFERSLPFWRISLVDVSAEVIREIRESLPDPGEESGEIRLLAGDGTSALVLEEAGVEDADAVVVTTGDDRVNREVCRLVVERYGRSKVVSLVNEETAQAGFPSPPVELVPRNEHLAGLLESRLHSDAARRVSLGAGTGQLIETTVMAGSSVIGRPLETLNARNWRIAAIHRGDELILPEGHTLLEAGDRVLLIGKADVLYSIAEYIRIGKSEFPRRYGDRLLLPLLSRSRHETLLAEALYLATNTKITGVDLLPWQRGRKDEHEGCEHEFRSALSDVHRLPPAPDPAAGALEWVNKGYTGCLLLPPPSRKPGMKFAGKKEFLRILEEVTCPILVPRGTHPYRKILVPVTDRAESAASAELAMDLARLLDSQITAASVLPPGFSVGEAELESQREALQKTIALGSLYRMRIDKLEKEGNPIREILRIARDFDLLVVSHRRDRPWKLFRPDISHHLILRAPCSVLVVEMGRRTP
jgi:Trk K+ transport system NAD-binding subunit